MKAKVIKSNLPYYFWKVSHFLYLLKVPLLPFLLKQVIRFTFGAVIPPQAQIGRNVHFAYNGLGIVVHGRAVLGNNVMISQHVTIGGRGGPDVPIIGNGVEIGAGACILGKVTIGNNAKIGANAVVLSDVPPGTTAVGVPARILGSNRTINP